MRISENQRQDLELAVMIVLLVVMILLDGQRS